MIKLGAILLSVALPLAAPPALAQQTGISGPLGAPGEVGKVVATTGPEGSVIVVRGSQAYSLASGDILFEGDRIVTRSNGGVTITANGCEKTLEPTTSVVIDDEICGVAPLTLAGSDPVVEIAPYVAPPAVGATPFVLPGIAAAGATAAALAGSQSTSEVVL